MDAISILNNNEENNVQSSLISSTLDPVIAKFKPFVILHYILLCLILIFLVLIYKQKIKQ